MTVPIRIRGGFGGDTKEAAVTGDGELVISSVPHPPLLPQKVTPFRQFFTVDGLSDGSNDMVVDGSATNVDFYIPASATADRYITNINILVAYGAIGKPFQWAASTPLTNGTRIFYETQQRGDAEIHESVKTNQDLFRLNHGGTVSGWEVRHVNANNDYGYFTPVDLEQYVPPFGIKLDKGSNHRMVFCVRDNLTLSTLTFNAIAYGFDRFE